MLARSPPTTLSPEIQSKQISDAVKQKERLYISHWQFRDRGILLKALLVRGRHTEGGDGFGVASRRGVYMGLTGKGGRLSKGWPLGENRRILTRSSSYEGLESSSTSITAASDWNMQTWALYPGGTRLVTAFTRPQGITYAVET